jgi:spermidine synthase
MVRPVPRQRLTLLVVTFVVSFCSFAYEFVYSELLTVMYGGTVTQYVVTVGLFFFSLGVGSALSDDLDGDRPANLFRTEVYLAVVAPAGFLLVVALNSVRIPEAVPTAILLVVARSPIVLVGLLSGFELPLLTRMVDDVGDDGRPLPRWLDALVDRVHAGVIRIVGVFWHVERSTETRSGLSLVLAMDYVGGLAGAVIYARVLYPGVGLVPTVFVLALLNGLAALVFLARFSGRWSPLAREDGALVSRESTALVVACLLVTAGCAGAVANEQSVEERISQLYLEQEIENDYAPGAVDAEIVGQRTTEYQHVVEYERTWTGSGPNPYFTGETERCLRLGTAVQLCDSWADSYHEGLVDVPMSLYDDGPDTEVLVIGGGDYVAVNHLREYDVTVDQVDIDGEFMAYARNDSWLASYHEHAHEYDRLTTTVGDGYGYLQRTNATYDLILLDVPGATDDDLLRLYSTEFYGALADRLEPDGVVGTWTYAASGYPQHNKAFLNTVESAGFERYAPYWAWEDLDSDGDTERVERFYLLAPGDRRALDSAVAAGNGTAYVREHSDRYRDFRWRETPRYRGVEANSIFDPNYDILVE